MPKAKKADLVRRKPFTEELIDSMSLNFSKPLEFKGKERQRIFGADPPVIPDGLTIFKMLEAMNEQQMLELNE